MHPGANQPVRAAGTALVRRDNVYGAAFNWHCAGVYSHGFRDESDSTAVRQPVPRHSLARPFFWFVSAARQDSRAIVRSFCSDLSALVRAVDFRDIEGGLSCVMGFGSDAWDRLLGQPRPSRVACLSGDRRLARAMPSRPRAICSSTFAPSAWTSASSWRRRSWRGSATRSRPVDEVHGFAISTTAICIGFVDGTENPTAQAAVEAVIIGAEDPAFAGGSYVIVQKYLHDVPDGTRYPRKPRNASSAGTKLSDIELDDAVKPTSAHNALTTIVEDGKEIRSCATTCRSAA